MPVKLVPELPPPRIPCNRSATPTHHQPGKEPHMPFFASMTAAVLLAITAIACAGNAGPHTVATEDAAAGPSHSDQAVEAPSPEQAGEALTHGGHDFAFDLYRRLADEEEGNIFLSPSSIRTALAMTWAGARGGTEEQMSRVLRFNLPPQQVHGHLAALLEDLNDPGTDEEGNPFYELAVANALWGQAGYPFRDDFIALLDDRYGAGLHEVDFIRETEPSRQRINRWVEQQTHDRISNLMPEGSIMPETRLVLTNAIYFLGGWEHTFDDRHTRDAAFHLPDGRRIEVPTMQQTERLRMMEEGELKVLELPYRGGEMAMLILLPNGGDDDAQPGKALERLEKAGKLTADNFRGWVERLRPRRVEVHLPRFSFTSEFGLNSTLAAMGMTDAFDPRRADFTGIASVEELFISAVQHKAFVKVDEEGTEAAAATGIAVGVTAMPPPPTPFHVDRPFLFIIRHNESGEILFMGRVDEPVEE